MAIGKKRSGSTNPAAALAARNERRQQAAVALAQKAAGENQAGNRQLNTAQAQASARAQGAHAPSNTMLRLGAEAARQRAQFEEAARQRGFQGEQQTLDRDWRSREAQLGREEAARQRDWQSGQTQLDRDWRSAEAQLGRDFQSGEAKLNREQQLKLQQMQNAAAMDRQREASAQQRSALRETNKSKERIAAGRDAYNLELQRLKNEGALGKENIRGAFAAGRDAAKYAHEREKWDYDAQRKRADFEYEETFKNRQKRADKDYEEQLKIQAENRKYGIPDGVELSNEDRAKILAGTHEYVGNTQDEKDQIAAYEKALSGQLTQDERDAIQLEYDMYREDHPANRVQEIPVERRAPKQTEINGQTYILNNGKWEPVPDREQKRLDREMKQKEFDLKREDAVRTRADKLYADLLSRPITVTETGEDGTPQKVTRMRTPEEAAEIVRRVYPEQYPAKPPPDTGAAADYAAGLQDVGAPDYNPMLTPPQQTEQTVRQAEVAAAQTTDSPTAAFVEELDRGGIKPGSPEFTQSVVKFLTDQGLKPGSPEWSGAVRDIFLKHKRKGARK